MAVKQDKSGKWLVQIDRQGIPRVRRSFPDRKSAERFEKDYLLAHQQKPASGDRRSLLELINLWYRYHGVNLSDGKRRRAILEQMAIDLGNPAAADLTPERFLEYRYHQTTRHVKPPSAKTLNNRLGYLDAVYRQLKKLKIIDYFSPLLEMDKIRLHEHQSSYLSDDQITQLFDALKGYRNESVWWIAQICIRTGARWGETEKLKRRQVHNGKLTFEFTKSKKVRSVPLDALFYDALVKFIGFKQPEDRIFSDSITAFNRAVKKAGIKLPRGQATHILRHSFASYFIMNGGNILVLQKILGHSDIKMTMRYAHLAPDHLSDAVKFNPLSDDRIGGKLAVENAKNRQ